MSGSRKVLIAAAAVICVPVVALLLLPFIVNGEKFRPALQTQLEQKLHAPVKLGGIALKTFPLALSVSDVLIGEPAGFAVPQPFVQAREVSISVALWPLLRGAVTIGAVRLDTPRIELVRAPAGAWNFGGAGAGDGSSTFTLDELTIRNGLIGVQDLKTGSRDVYEHIDVTLNDLGPGRHSSLTGGMRLTTMGATLKLQTDFQTEAPISARGKLTWTSDRLPDALNVSFDAHEVTPAGTIMISSLEAKSGALSATLSGSVNTHQTPAGLGLHFKTSGAPLTDVMHLAGIAGAKLPEGLKIAGTLQADVEIKGTTQSPTLSGRINATKAQITAKELKEPVRASDLAITLTPGLATVQPFTLETGGTKVSAQASVGGYSGSAPNITATLQTTGARLEELLRMADAYGVKPAGMTGSGAVSLDMKMTQTGKTVAYSGSGSLRGVKVTSPDLPKELTVDTADIKFADDRIGLDKLEAALSAMHMTGSLSVKNFARPDLQFNLHVDQINVDELSQMTAGGSSAKPGQTPSVNNTSLNNITARGAVAIDKVTYQQTALTNLKATVDLSGGVLKLNPVTLSIFGGQESGSITADLRAANAGYAIQSKLTAVDSGQLMAATSSVKGVVSGPLSGDLNLKFSSAPGQTIAQTLNGTMKMQMGPGRISGVQILNEIANVGHFMGFTKKQEAYTNINKLSGTLNIANGTATTNDLMLDLGGGILNGTGTMGLVDQALNLRLTAALTKEYQQKNGIGQVGGLLSTVLSNQKGELTIPVIVTGTFAQPKFAPDVEQMGRMKLNNVVPNLPGGLTDIFNQFRRKK